MARTAKLEYANGIYVKDMHYMLSHLKFFKQGNIYGLGRPIVHRIYGTIKGSKINH